MEYTLQVASHCVLISCWSLMHALCWWPPDGDRVLPGAQLVRVLCSRAASHQVGSMCVMLSCWCLMHQLCQRPQG